MNTQKRFNLHISDLDSAAKISQEWATHTISILDADLAENHVNQKKLFYKDYIPKPSPNMQLLQCYFDDVTPDDVTLADDFSVIPMKEDMQTILKFTEKLQANDKLLVHCHAGISRSTAVSCGILCQHGLSPKKAIEFVCVIRKFAYPNKYIIELMDDALELKGALKKALQESFNL